MNPDWIYGLLGGLLIGTASMVLLLGNGRIAGISGILGALLNGRSMAESVAFVAGLVGLPVLYVALSGPVDVHVTHSIPLLVVAGLLVGFGTRLGGGCTSGHGVCGMSRLSLRSLSATGTFMLVAGIIVFVTRHLIGGA